MDLYLSVRGEAVNPDCHIVVDADTTHTVADLCRALDTPDLLVARTGRLLVGDQALADADLRSGDDIIIGDAQTLTRRRLGHPTTTSVVERVVIVLVIVGGPDSGRSIPLAAGRHSIGRSHLADVQIDDRSVSRHHLDLVVSTDESCTLHVAEVATNGLTVDGCDVAEESPLVPGQLVTAGATRVMVRPATETDHHDVRTRRDTPARQGCDFHRTPYRPPTIREVDVDPVGPIPERPAQRRFGLVTALVPLVAGGALFLITRQVMFLALTLLSPVIMVGSVIEDRRSGRRAWRRDLADFGTRLDEAVAHLTRLCADERATRLAAAPDLAELVRRAEYRTIDLWPRTAESPDALDLRLGLGIARTRVPIELAAGGAADLRTDAAAAIAHLRTLDDVPITVDLGRHPILGIHGDTAAVDRHGAALIAQLATLHSPHDVVLVAAVAPDRRLDWCRWLPHARSPTSPVAGAHLVVDHEGSDALLTALITARDTRREQRTHHGSTSDRPEPWPRVAAILDAALAPDPVRVAQLLDDPCGMSVIWLADTAADVPHQADNVVGLGSDEVGAITARCWSTDPDIAPCELVAEQLRPHIAERLGRALAPIRDASTASRSGAIPMTVPLLDVVTADIEHIAAAWAAPVQHSLRVPLGMGADGPLSVDLVADGPHTLIGGTSGAGKSELLQSLVAGLAAAHPPTRLNLLFVDYKGGASTQVFERLPHSVGHVTNLSADLADRALVSLRAELRRRMEMLEGRAKDLAELLLIDPGSAPASLVIVVDEFATLVNEVPDFMAGIVDIAQRGRSLGIHLVLATQRPSGAVDENILANTNLRLALRMLDRADSIAVLGSPMAADIPVPRRGRGLVRLGPHHLTEFQSPWAGAPVRDPSASRRPLRISPFGFGAGHDRPSGRPPADPHGSSGGANELPTASRRSQLDEVVDAIATVASRCELPPPRRPWCDPLPDRVELSGVLDDVHDLTPGRHVPIGRLDDPERQRQEPAVLDLAAGAAMLVAAPGSGASTFVRTVVTAVGAMATEAQPAMALVLDMSGRTLADLATLPHVVDVASGDDLETVSRQLVAIDHLLGERRANGAVGANSMVVCVDGFDVLADTMLDPGANRDAERWLDIVTRLVLDGRQLGLSTVLTAARRSALPARLHAAVAHRLVLRQHDPTAYADLGISPQRGEGLASSPVGRCILDGRSLLQLAVADHPDVLTAGAPRATACSVPLPDDIDLGVVLERLGATPSHGPSVVIGVADVSGRPVVVDISWDDLVICGPPRSGRTTVMQTIAHQLGEAAVVVSGRRKPDHSLVLDQLEQLGRLLDDPQAGAVVVDDVDRLVDIDDPQLATAIDRIARRDDISVVGALDVRAMTGYSASPLVARLRRARRLLILRPDDGPDSAQLIGRPLRFRPGLRRPPGRGMLIQDGEATVVQTARLGGASPRAGSPHDVLFDNHC